MLLLVFQFYEQKGYLNLVGFHVLFAEIRLKMSAETVSDGLETGSDHQFTP